MKNKNNFCIAVVCAAVLSVFMSSSAFGWGKGTHAIMRLLSDPYEL